MARSRYFQRFNAIEIQQTFYEPPSALTAARWRAEAPPDFAFSVKAWQLITHPAQSPTYRRLRRTVLDEQARRRCGFFAPTPEVEQALRRTLEVAGALGARAVLFQTPAAFKSQPEHVANLRAFFRSHPPPPGCLFVWEPRGEWPTELVAELCGELGLVHATDPFVRPPVPGRVTYLRLHGRGGYRYRYSDEELDELARMLFHRMESQEEIWCLFNNVWMADDASRLMQRMAAGPSRRPP